MINSRTKPVADSTNIVAGVLWEHGGQILMKVSRKSSKRTVQDKQVFLSQEKKGLKDIPVRGRSSGIKDTRKPRRRWYRWRKARGTAPAPGRATWKIIEQGAAGSVAGP